MKLKITTAFLLAGLFIASCTKTEDPTKDLGTPETEHSSTDGVTDNGDGTTGVTLGGIDFTTTSNDYSNQTVVTTDQSATATLVESYDVGSDLENFRINGSTLVGAEFISSFDTKFLTYDLSKKSKIDEHDPDDFYMSGFDFNGAVMTVEGQTEINFYHLENGVITKHFFQIPGYMQSDGHYSSFLSTCFLDDGTAYIYNSDEIIYFHLSDTKTIKSLMPIDGFSKISFDSDENFVYILVRGSSAKIQKFDKSTNSASSDVKQLPSLAYGIAVDANYIYVTYKDDDKVEIFNKHTGNSQGTIDVSSPNAIDYYDGYIYVYSEGDKAVNKYEITFQ